MASYFFNVKNLKTSRLDVTKALAKISVRFHHAKILDAAKTATAITAAIAQALIWKVTIVTLVRLSSHLSPARFVFLKMFFAEPQVVEFSKNIDPPSIFVLPYTVYGDAETIEFKFRTDKENTILLDTKAENARHRIAVFLLTGKLVWVLRKDGDQHVSHGFVLLT